MNYVIIGNGTAAVGTIEGIRAVDKTGPITVISAEPYPVYGRPGMVGSFAATILSTLLTIVL